MNVSIYLREHTKCFYQIADRYRDSIEDLHIPDCEDPILRANWGGLLGCVSHFKNLKHVKLTRRFLPCSFDTLLNVCTTLETLIMTFRCPLYSPSTAVSIKQTRTKYPSLRQLEIHLVDFSLKYI